jgi:predicted lipid-binding transport protein (Tim44 family)
LGAGGLGQTPPTSSKHAAKAAEPIGIPISQGGRCVGALIASLCYGTVMPSSKSEATCHGTMVNGLCVGATF